MESPFRDEGEALAWGWGRGGGGTKAEGSGVWWGASWSWEVWDRMHRDAALLSSPFTLALILRVEKWLTKKRSRGIGGRLGVRMAGEWQNGVSVHCCLSLAFDGDIMQGYAAEGGGKGECQCPTQIPWCSLIYTSIAPLCFCLRSFSGHRSLLGFSKGKLDVPGAHLPSSNP